MKTKAAQSKVLIDAERELPGILDEIEGANRRLRNLAGRLKRAARTATPVAVYDGDPYTVEGWLATLLLTVADGEMKTSQLRRTTAASVRREIVGVLAEWEAGAERFDSEVAQRAAVERACEQHFAKVLTGETKGGPPLDQILAARDKLHNIPAGANRTERARLILEATAALPAAARSILESAGAPLAELERAARAATQETT